MVVDASAALAILLEEDDADACADRLSRSPQTVISAVNYWEVLVRMEAIQGAAGLLAAEQLLERARVSVAPADAELARAAARAFARFRGRPGGRLNLGDCFAYALAEREGDGLLFKGSDFPKTDVKSALAR